MHPALVLVALSTLACAACGGAIYVQSGLTRHSRAAAVAVFGWAWWGACQLLFHAADDPGTAVAIARASAPGWMFIGPLSLQVFLDNADRPSPRLRSSLRGLYAASAVLVTLSLATPWMIAGMRPAPWGWGLEPGPLFLVGYGVNMTGASLGISLALRGMRSLSDAERRQMSWILAAVLLPPVLISVTDVALPLLGVVFPPLGAAAFGPLAIVAFWLLVRFGYSPVAPLNFATEILGILPDGVVLLGADDRIRLANDAMARLCGTPVRDLRGVPIGDLLTWSFDGEARGEVHGALEGASGHRFPVAVTSSLLRDRAGNALGRVLVVRDLREVADLRSRLITSARLAAVGELAAGIAHEINNPLAFVRSNLSQLEERWKRVRGHLAGQIPPEPDDALQEVSADFDELLEESIEGVDRAAEIVRGVKGFAHAGPASREPADLGTLLDDVLHVAMPQLRDRVVVERDYGAARPVICAPQQLKQVFLNLVMNAAQAMEDGGSVRVSVREEGDTVVVSVRDDGCGIPPELIDRIFDPFFTTKGVGEGTGLGLGIAHQIVDSHGGEIEVESTPGRGSVFRVRIPAARSEAA